MVACQWNRSSRHGPAEQEAGGSFVVSAEVLPHCMRGERDGSLVAAPSVGCRRTRGTHALLYTLSRLAEGNLAHLFPDP